MSSHLRTIVFVGPTLPESHRTPPPGIDMHPPARCGDIAAAAAAGAAAIGLIDGVSEHGRSVWHKES